jgi:MFS family permease
MIELLERQKKLTANQWKLICTANVADLLDFFDFFLIGYVTAALTKEWSLPYWQGGAILLASGLGAVPGAFIWGWLGDRIGRRTVFMLSSVTISLATGIMVFTPGPSAVIPGWLFLVFFRVFVGIGNAGIFTIDLPLVQEFIPAYKRGWVSALVTTLLPGGGMLAGLVAAWLLPIIGWRYLFLVGLSPLVLVFMIRYWVQESPRSAGRPPPDPSHAREASHATLVRAPATLSDPTLGLSAKAIALGLVRGNPCQVGRGAKIRRPAGVKTTSRVRASCHPLLCNSLGSRDVALVYRDGARTRCALPVFREIAARTQLFRHHSFERYKPSSRHQFS